MSRYIFFVVALLSFSCVSTLNVKLHEESTLVSIRVEGLNEFTRKPKTLVLVLPLYKNFLSEVTAISVPEEKGLVRIVLFEDRRILFLIVGLTKSNPDGAVTITMRTVSRRRHTVRLIKLVKNNPTIPVAFTEVKGRYAATINFALVSSPWIKHGKKQCEHWEKTRKCPQEIVSSMRKVKSFFCSKEICDGLKKAKLAK